MPRILFVTVDWPTGAAFTVTVERVARILAVASTFEALQRLAESPFALVILDQTLEDGDARPLLQAAKAVRCSVLRIAEPVRIPYALDQLDGCRLAQSPITIQALIEGAGNALAADGRWPSELPRLGRWVSQAIERIRLNYHWPLTVTAIADAIHVSPSHLAHRFRSETGMAIKEYVTRVRIEIARRLLRETDAKLESIAHAVGFCDAPHLSRVFVQYTRRRPGEYRRSPAGARISAAALAAALYKNSAGPFIECRRGKVHPEVRQGQIAQEMERDIITNEMSLIEQLASMRTLRAWEDAHLPIYGSLLGRDLIFLLAQFELEQRRFTLKEIYYSLPYSENAVRLHLKRLIRDGWIGPGCVGADRRFRYVVLSEKLKRALETYYMGIRDGAAKSASVETPPNIAVDRLQPPKGSWH